MKRIVLLVLLMAVASSVDNTAWSQWKPVDRCTLDVVGCYTRLGNHLFVAGGWLGSPGISLSTDDGATWSSAGLEEQRISSFAVIGNTIFASADTAVYTTTDFGANWLTKRTVPSGTNIQITSLTVIGSNLFAAASGGPSQNAGCGVYRSTDQGESWTRVTQSLPDSNFTRVYGIGNMLFASFENNGFYTGGGLILSSDNGNTWSDGSLPYSSVYELAYKDDVMYAATSTGLYMSQDLAQSWTVPTRREQVYSVAVYGSKIFVTTDQAGIHLTTDAGDTWRGIDSDPVNEGFTENWGLSTAYMLMVDSIRDVPRILAGTGAGLWSRPLAEFDEQPATAPINGQWEFAPEGDSAGVYYGASCTVGGKVYIVGGLQYGGYYTQLHTFVEVFDPVTQKWSSPTLSGSFTPRYFLSAAVVDGKIYTIGGTDGSATDGKLTALSTLEVFDPLTNAWSTRETSGASTPRYGATATVINGKIYVIGGFNAVDSIISRVDVLDPTTNTWSSVEPTGNFIKRYNACSAALNDKIYVWGGYTGRYESIDTVALQIFDPATNTWATPQTTGKATPRYYATAGVFQNKLYWIGGKKVGSAYLSTFELFDPATSSWSTPMTEGRITPRRGLMSAVFNDKIYVIGGYNGVNASNSNEVYTPLASAVREQSTDLEMTIYPNPTPGKVNIEGVDDGVDHVIVRNILGNIEFETDISPSSTSLDLSKLSDGIFYLSLTTGGAVLRSSVVLHKH